LVNLGDNGVENFFEFLLFLLEFFSVGIGVRFDPLEGFFDKLLELALVTFVDLILKLFVPKELNFIRGFLLDGLSDGITVVFEGVLGFDLLLDEFIFVLIFLSFLDHLFDVFLGESSLIVGDGDLVGLSGGLVDGGDVQDTVGVDIEGNFDLGNTSWCGWDAVEVEFTQQVVVLGHGSLTFEDLDQDSGLVVSVGGEGLLLLGGDGGISADQDSHDTSSGFNTLGQGGDIQQEEVLDLFVTLAGQDGSLDGGTEGDGLIGVDGSVGLLSVEEVLDELDDLGDSSGTTDKDDFVDLGLGETGVLEDLFDGGDSLLELGEAEFFELGLGDDAVVIFGFGEGVDFDVGLGGRGQDSLGSFALSSESSHGSWVLSDVVAGLSEEIGSAEFDELVIEIFTSQVSITGGGLNFEDTVFDGQEGDIESTTSEIEDQNILFTSTFLIKTVSNSSGGGFIDNSKNVESRNDTSVLSGLSLRIVEVGRDGNDSILDWLVKESFSSFLHLQQDHGGDLFGVEFLGFSLELDDNEGLAVESSFDLEWPKLTILLDDGIIIFSTDESLGIEDSVNWVSGNLVLGGITDKSFGISEGDVRRSSSVTLVVGNDFYSVVDPDSDTGVGGTKIDTNSG
jgi:hypothetical protein